MDLAYDHRSLSMHSRQGDSAPSTTASSSTRWSPEHSRDACNKCREKFHLLNRKHHCRVCGLLFCQKCSPYRVRLNKQSHKSRVCESCLPNAISKTAAAPPMNSIHTRVWVPRGLFSQMLSYLNHRDLCAVSIACRWWYKRSSLDLIWRPLYIRHFGEDGDAEDSMATLHRNIHGVEFNSLPFKKKFSVRSLPSQNLRTSMMLFEKQTIANMV